MKSPPRIAVSLIMSWLMLSIIFSTTLVAADGDIKVKSTSFDHPPSKYFLFRESSIMLLHERQNMNVWRSVDHGGSWLVAKGLSGKSIRQILSHPTEKKWALATGNGREIYRSQDLGESWEQCGPLPSDLDYSRDPLVEFNHARPDYLLTYGKECAPQSQMADCKIVSYYSRDYCKSWQPLRSYVTKCMWARGSAESQALAVDSVYCSEYPDKTGAQSSKRPADLQLTSSDNFYGTLTAIRFDGGQLGGVLNFGIVNKFLVVARKSLSGDLDMYVSIGENQFANTRFPADINYHEFAYTVLDSTSVSLVVDVYVSNTYGREYGTLLTSNSNGTYFRKSLDLTHRDSAFVDFERVQGVDGILLANVVTELDQTAGTGEPKRVESRLSLDNGGTWQYLRPPPRDLQGNQYECVRLNRPAEDCSLHLHSFMTPHQKGFMYSDSAVPGLLMGVGSVGSYLAEYQHCDLFISTDGGLNWQPALSGPHRHESLDMGGVLVAAPNWKSTDKLSYSTDFGKQWRELTLGINIEVKALLSDTASTGQVLIVLGSEPMANGKHYVVQVDFRQLFSRQCQLRPDEPGGGQDFQLWTARGKDADSECLFGRVQSFYRRRPEAQCYVGRVDQSPPGQHRACACSRENYECDINYQLDPVDGKTCRPAIPQPDRIPTDKCRQKGDKYMGSSGYRRVPGDQCEGGDNNRMDQLVEKPCPDGYTPPPPITEPPSGEPNPMGEIRSSLTRFNALILSHSYFQNGVLMLTDASRALYRSTDEGASWEKISLDGKLTGNEYPVMKFIQHDHVDGRGFAITWDGKMFYTSDWAKSFSQIPLPSGAPPNRLGLQYLDFHPTEPDWLLYTADSNQCPGNQCHSQAFISTDNGRQWLNNDKPFDTYVHKCLFAQDIHFTAVERDSIYCSAYEMKTGNQQAFAGQPTTASGNVMKLYKYTRFGAGEKRVLAAHLIQYYVFEKFMAAAVESGGSAKLMVSLDGQSLVDAQFPPDMRLEKQAFTVLQSTTGSVFLNVLRSRVYRREHGSLFSSNANGTYFHVTLNSTNVNGDGLVDFEKLRGIEGGIIANQIQNLQQVLASGERKQVQSMISFNDGGLWHPLRGPGCSSGGTSAAVDSSTASSSSLSDECRLNLHSRSELSGDSGPLFSAGAAPGLLLGVGNTGSALLPYTQSDTYLSRDGGRSWRLMRQGPHLYEFGGRGSLLVMVDDSSATDTLYYSWNDGGKWFAYRFLTANAANAEGQRMRVNELTIEPKWESFKFILFGTLVSTVNQSSAADVSLASFSPAVVQVDFSQLNNGRACQPSDYEQWIPPAADGSSCVLGRETTFTRRRPESNCFISVAKGGQLPAQPAVRNCTCTKYDYECDIGFWRSSSSASSSSASSSSTGSVDNTQCQLINGRDPLQPANCPANSTYSGRSGYSRLAMSTCTTPLAEYERPVQRQCSATTIGGGPLPLPQGSIAITEFPAAAEVDEIVAFPQTTRLLLRDKKSTLWLSKDSGSTWQRVAAVEQALRLVQNQYRPERVYFINSRSPHYMTTDGAETFQQFHAPNDAADLVPNTYFQPYVILEFHAFQPDWLIFTGQRGDCSRQCYTAIYYTQTNGAQWSPLTTYAAACQWGMDTNITATVVNPQLILCNSYPQKTGHQPAKDLAALQLQRSEDFFRSVSVPLESIVKFDIAENFIVAAQLDRSTDSGVSGQSSSHASLKLWVTADGKRFAQAIFPPGHRVDTTSFTVLESGTGRMFLAVGGGNRRVNAEWATLYISNGNGTFFSQSLPQLNTDRDGYSDWEKMLGLGGAVLLANQVANAERAAIGEPKQLQTRLSVSAGSLWQPLEAPKTGVDGRSFGCVDSSSNSGGSNSGSNSGGSSSSGSSSGGGLCNLHLHGYTERSRVKNELSDSRAIGLLVGPGNVGGWLSDLRQSDMFLSRDGGLTWQEVLRGWHLFEFIDHGSILVFVRAGEATGEIIYSLNQGRTFERLALPTGGGDSDSNDFLVDRIITSPKSLSRQFLLVAKRRSNSRQVVISVDLSQALSRQCTGDDFEMWQLGGTDKCIFGRQTQFKRRRQDTQCFIGELYGEVPTVIKQCECSWLDYECEPGFDRVGGDGGDDGNSNSSSAHPATLSASRQCQPQPGYTAQWSECGADGKSYWPTGYRRIPMNSCQGGVQLDRGEQRSCLFGVGYSTGAWIAIILIPLAVAAVLGTLFYRWHWRSGGAIRLPGSLADARRGSGGSASVASLASAAGQSVVRAASGVQSIIGGLWGRLRNKRMRYSRLSADPIPPADNAEVLLDDYA